MLVCERVRAAFVVIVIVIKFHVHMSQTWNIFAYGKKCVKFYPNRYFILILQYSIYLMLFFFFFLLIYWYFLCVFLLLLLPLFFSYFFFAAFSVLHFSLLLTICIYAWLPFRYCFGWRKLHIIRNINWIQLIGQETITQMHSLLFATTVDWNNAWIYHHYNANN